MVFDDLPARMVSASAQAIGKLQRYQRSKPPIARSDRASAAKPGIRRSQPLLHSIWRITPKISSATARQVVFGGLVVGILVTVSMPSQAEESYKLAGVVTRGDVSRVNAVVEVKGDLKVEGAGERVTRFPLKVRSTHVYEEQTLVPGTDAELRRDVRQYERADAVYEVAGNRSTTALPDDRKRVVVSAGPSSKTIYATDGPLSRDELELLDIQGNTAIIHHLLPPHAVRIGDHWEHADLLVGQLLGLDAVQQNGVESSLRIVEGKVAIVDMKGSVRGAADGVPSDIEVRGKYNVDLKRGRITWFTMAVKENRAIGRAEPGFELTARVRVTIEPSRVPSELSDSSSANAALEADQGALVLRFTSPAGGFRFLHDRDWRTIVDRHDVSVLRMMEGGNQVAQCNVSRLADTTPGNFLTLKSFQAEVRRALGERFGEFQEATQSPTDANPRVLRVDVSGVASGISIQWTYYHICDARGRRASLVFTRDVRHAEAFGAADELLVDTFQLFDRPQARPVAETAQSRDENSGGTR